jgi:hypothetical protein
MGGSTNQQQNQLQVATTAPWGPAGSTVAGILGKLNTVNPELTATEANALNALSGLGAAGNPYAGQIGNVANALLAGGTDRTGLASDAYRQYQTALNPFASGQHIDPSADPALQRYLQVARDDATNSVNAQFAAAGRDLSGMNTQALGRGIMQAEAPVLAQAYQAARQQQLDAINSLYNAGNSSAGILSGLDQAKLANMRAGLDASNAANAASQYGPLLQLQAEAQRRGIPLQTLAAEMGIALPAAQAFSTTNTTGAGNATTSLPLAQQLAGGLIGGAGLLSGLGFKPFGTLV